MHSPKQRRGAPVTYQAWTAVVCKCLSPTLLAKRITFKVSTPNASIAVLGALTYHVGILTVPGCTGAEDGMELTANFGSRLRGLQGATLLVSSLLSCCRLLFAA